MAAAARMAMRNANPRELQELPLLYHRGTLCTVNVANGKAAPEAPGVNFLLRNTED
jgi:hypothetical protein